MPYSRYDYEAERGGHRSERDRPERGGYGEREDYGGERYGTRRDGRFASRYHEDEEGGRSRGGGRYSSEARHEGQLRGGEVRHERALHAPRDQEGHSRDMGQGGWFGDYEGHSEIGRYGGQLRHERAMQAPHDREGYAEDVGQGGWFGDHEAHVELGRYGGELRHERAMQAPHDERGYARDVGQGGWFGDFEGHSRAARRGWGEDPDEEPSRGRSRSRYGRYEHSGR